MMHEHQSEIPYALFTPSHEIKLDDGIVRCPLYSNLSRFSNKRSSSFLCYIPLSSEIPEDLLFKKGIMIAIDDREQKT